MQKLVVILIIVLSFCSCKHDYNPPPDFNFSLSYGYFDDQISTFDSTYRTFCDLSSTRSGDTILEIFFTKEEKQSIYRTLIKYDYLNIPDTIMAHECITPCASGHSQLIVVSNSKKKVIYTVDCCPINHYMQVFDSIKSPILKILFSKKEIKNLPRGHDRIIF